RRLVHVHELAAARAHHGTTALAHAASINAPPCGMHGGQERERTAAAPSLNQLPKAVMNLRWKLRAITHGPPRAVHSFTHLGDRIVPAPVFHALVFWLPVFLFSTTVHEAAHAWAALRLGDPTAYLAGQVSLSPWPHVRRSPIGMLVVPLITSLTQGWTMGWASAPYDPVWADRHPRRAALMALAGPLGNFAIAAAAFALLRAGLAFGVFEAPHTLGVQHLVTSALPADRLLASDFLAEGLSVLLA